MAFSVLFALAVAVVVLAVGNLKGRFTANALADRGVRVILAGTDMDFRGCPFGPMAALLAVDSGAAQLSGVTATAAPAATQAASASARDFSASRLDRLIRVWVV